LKIQVAISGKGAAGIIRRIEADFSTVAAFT
jgi:hypothetical protein